MQRPLAGIRLPARCARYQSPFCVSTREPCPDYLRLKGGESLSSFHKQALLARRQQSFFYTAETCLEYEPDSIQQMAGLICIYDNTNFYYLHVTTDEKLGKCLDIITCTAGEFDFPLAEKISLSDGGRCYLRARVDYDKLVFSYSEDGNNWTEIRQIFDASTLSDEFDEGGGDAHFTGAFVGICNQDLTGRKKNADFDYFEYTERDKLEL